MNKLHFLNRSERHLATRGSYVLGYGLSLLLTLAAFGIVLVGGVTLDYALPILVVLAVAQLFVQLLFFMHLDRRSSHWNAGALALTAVMVLLIVGGTLWIMYHLNLNMAMDPAQVAAYMHDQ